MLEQKVVTFEPGDGFSIVGAEIFVDEQDYEGVHIAANNLSQDFTKVTGQRCNPIVKTRPSAPPARSCIVIGSLTKSPLIQQLKEQGKIDPSQIEGKWESWITTVVHEPFDGYDDALVIAGSDKRGTIFGTYSLSEQIGVSPWHWWADVPPKKQQQIYALPVTTSNGEPSVKYRGIFINDECPGMDSWVHEKFGPTFDANLYHYIFELLLRLKANFMWPAMWRGYPYPGRSFFVDDPKNQELADTYGIVMGTSHHEPMQRAMNEWSTTQPGGTWNWDTNKEKVTQYFEEGAERAVPYESYFTMGMRGEGDVPMTGGDPVKILTEVLDVQRNIIKKNYGKEDGVLQLMALYKEVQGYYEKGLKIPDDVTLLFGDDNFGNLRRLPTEEENKRSGGSGFYYHFQYTGYPRCYRWINSNTLGKALHQLQLAHHRGADRIWIFNVGDLKPVEVPMSFAFDLAWDINSITATTLPQYFEHLATREFGEQYAGRIAKSWHDFNKLVAIRKQDHIDASTFVIQKYHESDNIIARWRQLLGETEAIYSHIDEEHKSAFFQLVLHPVKATYIFTQVRVAQYTNQLFAKQRRNTTNTMLKKCIELLDADHDLFEEYNSISDGKWDLMLRQPHYGYGDTGAEPSRNMIDGLCYVQTKEDSNPSVGHMGVAVEGIEGINPGHINEDSDRTHPSRGGLEPGVTLPFITPYGEQTRYFEVFHRGTKEFSWEARPQYKWIKLSQYQGHLNPRDDDIRVIITIDWSEVPTDFDAKVIIEVIGTRDGYEQVHMTVRNSRVPADFEGFVEESGHLAIDAGNVVTAPYILHPALGRPIAGAVTLPLDYDFSKPDGIPFLRYPIYVFSQHDNTNLELQFNITLETEKTSRMQYDVRFDGGPIKTFRLTDDESNADDVPRGWAGAVMDCVWKKGHNLGTVKKGSHTIEVRFRSQNICLEKLIFDLGDLRYTYLGPPQSAYVKKGESQTANVIGQLDSLKIDLGF
ncbi:hypothetical protein THAR02_01123 [Trichoderma harzianum]|uniref:Gylcosyl hydrolase 115 C-terminal domain-containing protein n=1 Tax=Trichoderma harzianum TaxID=5544 RepID=A0A0F9Y3Q8_TRIHA|nr:hypothetical protein THAR02_01123 [Trichoderma harzianum]